MNRRPRNRTAGRWLVPAVWRSLTLQRCGLAGMLLWAAAVGLSLAGAGMGWGQTPPASPDWVGYRGDGSGVYAAPGAPVAFDEATGSNVLWRAALPNWGHGSPIAMGGRVFVTTEGGWKEDFPLLLCFDAATGKELWRRELNHVPALPLPDEQKAAILKRWSETMEVYRKLNRLWNEIHHASVTNKPALEEKFRQETGWIYKPQTSGGYLENCRAADGKAWNDFLAPLAKANLTLDSWYHNHGDGLSCVGQTYPTPLCDGQRVYAVTAFGGIFAYDLAGASVWQAFLPGDRRGDYCSRARSPILHSGLLLVDLDGVVRALDPATGAVRWRRSHGERTYMTIVTPAVVETAGTPILLSGGMDGSGGELSLKAFRVSDGLPIPVVGWRNGGATMVTKSDERDVVFFTGGGEHGGWEKKGGATNPPPAAIRFALEGGVGGGSNLTLKATVLWAGVDGKSVGSHTQITYHRGKLYCGGTILDAATGKVLAGAPGKRGARATPETHHLLLVAGERLYGLDGTRRAKGDAGPAKGALNVRTLDGKPVASSMLTNAPADEGEKRLQCSSQNGHDLWGFSYGYTFTFDEAGRLFVRSHDYLWGIGRK